MTMFALFHLTSDTEEAFINFTALQINIILFDHQASHWQNVYTKRLLFIEEYVIYSIIPILYIYTLFDKKGLYSMHLMLCWGR